MADHFDVFMLTLGALGANCFLLASGGKALIVDPGDEADVVAAACDEIAAAPQAILVTHGHFDHIGGVDALARRFAVPVYVGEADAGLLRRPDMGAMAGFAVQPVTVDPVLLDAETELDLALPVTAVPTPGHSEGSFSFFIEDICSAATCSSRAASGAPTCPAAPPTSCSTRSPGSSAALRPTRSCIAATGPTPRWVASSRSTHSCRHCATTRSTAGERPESP